MDENLRYRAVFRRKGIAGDTEIIAMKELANYIINIISEKMDFMAKNDLYNAVVQNRNIFDAALKAIKAD